VVFALQLSLCGTQDLSFGNQHDVERERRPVPPEALPQQTLGAIAAHRSTHPTIHGEPQPAWTLDARQRDQAEQRALAARAAAKDRPEVLGTPEPLARAESLG
jgi:hypothetical protein